MKCSARKSLRTSFGRPVRSVTPQSSPRSRLHCLLSGRQVDVSGRQARFQDFDEPFRLRNKILGVSNAPSLNMTQRCPRYSLPNSISSTLFRDFDKSVNDVGIFLFSSTIYSGGTSLPLLFGIVVVARGLKQCTFGVLWVILCKPQRPQRPPAGRRNKKSQLKEKKGPLPNPPD